MSADAIFAEVLAAWQVGLDAARVATAGAAFFDFFQQRLVAYDDARPALVALRAAGVRIGVLTDVPYGMPRRRIERDLVDAGLADLVDVLRTSVDVGWRKPDPRGFLALAHDLGVRPEALRFVGNEAKDVEGARAAGMRAVWLDRAVARPPQGSVMTTTSLRALVPSR